MKSFSFFSLCFFLWLGHAEASCDAATEVDTGTQCVCKGGHRATGPFQWDIQTGYTLVNTDTSNHQQRPSAAYLTNGKYVVVWESSDQYSNYAGITSNYAIYAQLYAADGTKDGNEFKVNTYGSSASHIGQQMSSVAALDSGKFVVTWSSHYQVHQDGHYDVFGQRYKADGTKDGSEFRVNTETDKSQSAPSVAHLGSGKFVVVWHSQGDDLYSRNDIYGQRYAADGTTEGSEFHISTSDAGDEQYPTVAALDAGKFVVAWNSVTQTGDHDTGVYAQRYKADGTTEGSELHVNTQTYKDQKDPSIAHLGAGKFVVVWWSEYGTSSQDSNGYGVYGQRYAADGTKEGSDEFVVNTHTSNNQWLPSVASLSNGKFVVTWVSHDQASGSSGDDIYAQHYAADGTKEGSAFLVNTVTANSQSMPCVASTLDENRFIVVWNSQESANTAYTDIHSRRYFKDIPQCIECASLTYRAEGDPVNGSATTCAAWTTCPAGQYLDGRDETQDGTCTPCASGSYQPNAYSTVAQCTAHSSPTCDADEVFNAGTSIADAHCACDAGYHVDTTNFVAAAQGSETQANSVTTYYQRDPSVAYLNDGRFVVAYASDAQDLPRNDVYMTIRNADGTVHLNHFKVNTFSDNYMTQFQPSVAHLGNNNFVVVWASAGQDSGNAAGGYYGVYGQRFTSASSNKLGSEFHVNTKTTYNQYFPSVAALEDGKFVVVWQSDDETQHLYDIRGQLYKADGTKEGTEFTINTVTSGDDPSGFGSGGNPNNDAYTFVSHLGSGKFVVAWGSYRNSRWDIYAQRYAADGTKEGNEFMVNSYFTSTQQRPCIAHLGSGKFVVAWESWQQDGSEWGIYAQRYAANGTKEGSEFRVNTVTTSNDQEHPSVAHLGSGKFVVVWHENLKTYAKLYKANGATEIDEFVVSSNTNKQKFRPSVAGSSDGKFVVAWESQNQVSSNSAEDIYFQRYFFGKQPIAGSMLCAECAADAIRSAGDVKSSLALTTCDVCSAAGTEANADGDVCVCKGGKSFDGAQCMACAAGTYRAKGDSLTGNATTCEACLSGTYSTGAQATCTAHSSPTCDADEVVIAGTSIADAYCACDAGYHVDTSNIVATAQGSETQVNTYTTDNQELPSVAMHDDGSYVVVWQSKNQVSSSSGYDVYGQRYKADGTPEYKADGTTPDEFRVNTHTTSNQAGPFVAALEDGKFVVVWSSENQVPDTYTYYNDVFAQRYKADGTKDGSEFRVNSHTTSYQNNPSVAHLGSGKFVVVWESYHQVSSNSQNDIYAQRYTADGTKDGSEFLVNTETDNNQAYHSVAHLGSGKFVVVWKSLNQVSSTSDNDIYAQIYEADGSKQGGEFLVNTYTTNDQANPSVAGLDDGTFVVLWESSSGDDIYAQRYKADGTPEYKADGTTPDNFLVANNERKPSVAHIGSGKFVIAWQSSDGSGWGINAQLYAANGTTEGDEFTVSTETTGSQEYPSIAGLSNGKFVIAWESQNQVSSNSAEDIYFQRYAYQKDPIAGSMLCAECAADAIRSAGDVKSSLALTTCDTCSAGSEPNAEGDLCLCKDGHSFDGAQCNACAAGTYRAGGDSLTGNATTCTPCPAETYSSAESASCTAWTTCAAGEYLAGRDATQDGTCTPCPAGSFQGSSNKAAACTACPAGEYIGTTGASSCLPCASGTFSTGGAEECLAHYLCSANSTEETAPTSSNDRVCACEAGHSYLEEAKRTRAEERVSTYETGSQQRASVAALKNGKYVVVWESDGQASIVSSGARTISTSQADCQTYATNNGLTYDPTWNEAGAPSGCVTSGAFLKYNTHSNTHNCGQGGWPCVEFVSGKDIYAQRYKADGTKEGGEFLVNTETSNDQQVPSVAHVGSGKFVVTWESYNQASGSSSYDIYAQIYEADGSKQGGEFQVNDYTTNEQIESSVAGLGSGKFVIAWQSNGQDSSSDGVYAQRFLASGTKDGSEFLVNTETTNSQGIPSVAHLGSGTFVVTYQSSGQDGSGNGVYAQRYKADGTTEGGEFLVNTETTSSQQYLSIAHLGFGKFVVVWTSYNQDASDSWGIYAQRYAADGTKEGNETQVNTYTTYGQQHPTVAALDAGKFVVAWQSQNQDTSNSYGVYAQMYKADGTPLLEEFLVNSATTGDQDYASVAGLGNDAFVIAYDSPDSDSDGIFKVDFKFERSGCTGCAAGTSRAGGDLSSGVVTTCAPCLAGEYAPATAASCTACAGDTYSTGGAAECTAQSCPTGYEISVDQGAIAADVCEKCSNGYHLDTSNFVLTEEGSETQVNTYTDNNQELPSVAMHEDGSYVVVWQSMDQHGAFVSSGSPSDYGLSACQSAASSLGYSWGGSVNWYQYNGNYVPRYCIKSGTTMYYNTYAAWYDCSASGYDCYKKGWTTEIYGQRYAADGTKAGSEFMVNTHYDNYQKEASVAALDAGKFVVVWQSSNQDGSGDGIYAQRYAADGTKEGSEFRVNTYTSSNQDYPSVAHLDAGKFVVVWQSSDQEYIMKSSGLPNWTLGQTGCEAAAAALGKTYHGIVYWSFAPRGCLTTSGGVYYENTGSQTVYCGGGYNCVERSGDYGIYAQLYAADGTKEGSETLVNTYTTEHERYPSVAALDSGKFVVTWESEDQDTDGYGVYAQRFAADGTEDGSEFQVNTETTLMQQNPSVAHLGSGKFVVAWQSYSQDVTNSWGIYAQLYAADGTKDGTEFLVNTETSNTQQNPSVAALSDGQFVVAWESVEQVSSSSYNDIYAKVYSNGAVVVDEFLVNTVTTSAQHTPIVAAVGSDKFVVVWNSYNQASGSSETDIYSQRYAYTKEPIAGSMICTQCDSSLIRVGGDLFSDLAVKSCEACRSNEVPNADQGACVCADGHSVYVPVLYEKEGLETRANTYTTGTQQDPSVTFLSNGKSVVVWESYRGSTVVSSGARTISTSQADCQAYASNNGIPYYGTTSWSYQASGCITTGPTQVYYNTHSTTHSCGHNGWSCVEFDNSKNIYAQLYAADGTAEGDEFRVNTHTAGDQENPTVAALDDGTFVVVWQSNNQVSGTSLKDIYAQRYAADGTTEGSEFQVNTYTTNQQTTPSVAHLGAGKFVVTWQSWANDGDKEGVYAQRYKATSNHLLVHSSGYKCSYGSLQTDVGNVGAGGCRGYCLTGNNGVYDSYRWSWVENNKCNCVNTCTITAESAASDLYEYTAKDGSEFLVNTETSDAQFVPIVAALDTGKFVIAWQSNDGSGWGIYAQRYAANGTKDSTEFKVNDETSDSQIFPSIASLGSGKFVIAWQSYGQDGSQYGIHAQRYAADGTTEGSEFQVNNETSNTQEYASVAGLSDGSFVVAWHSGGGHDGGGKGIFAQAYHADGTLDGAEFQVNSESTNDQQKPSVAASPDATRFVVAWYSLHGSSSENVQLQRYSKGYGHCNACSAGTFRASGDSLVGSTTSCEACPVQTYSGAEAGSCTPWTTCAAGYYLAGSPDALQDGTCTPCAAGTYQPNADSVASSCDACPVGEHSAANASSCTAWAACAAGEFYTGTKISGEEHCQTHYVCSANSTEVMAPTSTNDRVCACEAGHSLGESYKLVTSGEGSSHSIVTAAECQNSGYTWQGSVSLSSYPYGCVIVDGVSAYFNTQNTQVTCGSQVEGSIILSTEDILPEVITEAECTSHAAANGYNVPSSISSSDFPRGCVRVGGGNNVYYNTLTTSTHRCNEDIPNYSFAGCFVKENVQSACYVSDGLKCQPCAAGTSRAGGDLSNAGATTCAACAAGSFADSVAAATCTAYSEADCDKGLELVTSGKQAPLLTEDASCSACVEGKWQGSDSTTSLCQPHTDLSCDASTEVGNGTATADSTSCVCKGGHHHSLDTSIQQVNTGPPSGYLTRSECNNNMVAGVTQSSIMDWNSNQVPYGCICGNDPTGNLWECYYNTVGGPACGHIRSSWTWYCIMEVPTGCTACAAGTYRAKGDPVSGSTTTCDACPAETYSTGTAAECSPWSLCAAGHYNSAPLATANSVCSVCPANTYSGTSSRLSACLAHRTECPTGKQLKAGTGNTTHDIECEACPAGTFQASTGAACATWRTTCDKGTQLELDGSASQDHSCSTCASGKFQPLDATADACADYRTSCPPGFALQDDGTAETDRTCQACSNTTFKDDHGNHSCTTFRTTCPAGSQLVLNGNTEKDHECQLCPQGTYKEASGAEACAVCEAAKEVTPLNAVEGATGCVACTQATHMDSDGLSHTACELLSGHKCPAGMGYLVTVATKPNLCLPCAAGTFQASDDSVAACVAHSVTTCPAAQQLKAGTAVVDSQCEACPSGTYKAGSGAEACLPWLYEVCALGYERILAPSTTQDGNCSACAAGYFNNGKNAEACKAHRQICPAGFGLQAGTTEADASCVSCVSGTFSHALDGGACVAHRSACAAGEALGTDGDASKDHSCTPCASGTYNTDGTTCLTHTDSSCVAGKGFAGSSTVDGSCSVCVNSYQPNAASTAACKAWTTCDTSTEIESQAPSTTQDRVCACKEGHRFDKNTGACVACGVGLKRAAGDIKLVLAQ